MREVTFKLTNQSAKKLNVPVYRWTVPDDYPIQEVRNRLSCMFESMRLWPAVAFSADQCNCVETAIIRAKLAEECCRSSAFMRVW